MNKLNPPLSPHQAARRMGAASIALLTALFISAPPAWAQLARIGDNPDLGASPARGTDTAYDPVNNVYLVVGATAAFTPLWGIFANSSGAPITAPFQINTPAAEGVLAHFPRVTYSPHVSNGAGGFGGFLVTWHGGLWTNTVRARVVAYPNRLVTAETDIPSGSTFQEAGPAVAYSSASQVFLVTWQGGDFMVWGALIGTNGQLIGSAFAISDWGVGARDPNVVWNPQRNEFGVVYTGFGPSGATTSFARVNTAGSVLRRNTFNFAPSTYITDLAFNSSTGRFLAAWFQGGTFAAEIDANGDVVSQGLLSTATGTRDGLGVAYNANSGTFLLVGMGPSYNIWAAELNGRGARTSADTEITAAGGPVGSFHPRTETSTSVAGWNISFAHNNDRIRDQAVQTSSAGGGPAGSLGAPPPSDGGGSTTSTGGCTTPDPFAAMGGGTCINGGWVPGTSGSGGGTTSGGCTTASPGTGWTCVNGGWVPPTTTSSGSTSGGCTTPDPFIAIGGGTCINGGWVPGGTSTTSSTSSCTTPSPGTGWTCVNGGWLPPTSGGGGGGGCTTPDPFVAIGGGTCVNGGWIPGGSGSSSCTTPSPGTGWTCVNGGWLPPTTSTSSSGGCTTPDPFASMGGGTCTNGGWTFGSSGSTTSSGGCTTPDPFTAMGGGICINGGWIPKT